MTVNEVLARYRAALRCRRPETVDTRLAHLRRHLGGLDADTVRGHHLTAYRQARLAEGVSDSTVNREICALRAAYSRALDDELLERAPRFRMEPEPPPRQGFLTLEGLAKVCEKLQEPVYRDIIRFAFFTGWRKRAVLGLGWDAVSADSVTLPAAASKNGRPVIFPRVGEVDRILRGREQRRRRGVPWVFHRRGQPVRDFRRSWQRAVTAAGFPGLLFHDLRRSFAHWQLRCGIPREVTKRLAGWRTDSMYSRYCIVDQTTMAEALTRSEEILRERG